MQSSISLNPLLQVKAVYGHDREWWEDHLEKFCAINPESRVNPEQIIDLFGKHMNYAMYHQGINMAAVVVEFWNAHPSVEELLCKK